MKKTISTVMVSAPALLLGLASPAFAQTTPLGAADTTGPNVAAPTTAAVEAQVETQGDDIVVTAQKQTTSLRESPVSVAVVTSDSLRKSGVTTLDDMGKTVPSLTALPSNSTLRPSFAIRGVSTDVLSIGTPSGVAVMVDGVTIAPESFAAKQLSDVQNVEVLRGPQSTLGGRSASIGVINIVTRKPNANRLEGNVSATATTDNEYRGSGFITGPITKGVSFALSGFAGKTTFLTRNLTTGKHDTSASEGVRGKLLLQPTDNLDITLAATYVHTKDDGAFQAYIGVAPTAQFRGIIAQSAALPGITAQRGNTDYATITTPGQDVKDQLYSMTVDWRVGDFTLSSITAHQAEKRFYRQDLYIEAADFVKVVSGGTNTFNNIQTSDLDISGYSQEFKVASPDLGIARFIAGLYFDQQKSGFQFDRKTFGFNPLLFSAYRPPNNKTYAAYARVNWKLTEGTTLITGLRINRDVIAYTYQKQIAQPNGPNLIDFTRSDSSSKNTLVGDATLKQQIGRRANIYATYSRGYKPEIWNLDGAVTPTNTFKPVGREKVNSFELGMKGDFFDRFLTLNVAAFYTKYNNFQVQSLDYSNPLGATTFDVRNAAAATTRGVEVDGTLRPAAGLNITFSGAYVNSHFNDFKGAVCYSGQTAAQGCTTVNGASSQDLSGVDLPRSPHWKFNAAVDKTLDLSTDWGLDLNATFNYQSKTNFDPNHSPRAVQAGYGILNLSAGLNNQNGRYSITAFVNNVTNKSYVSNITDYSGRWGNQAAITGWYSRDAHRYGGIRVGAKF
ncbi:TonB-dependent receptor [Sphingomonas glacialis]|uniref:TonB-dependent receptor n=1 Tax=Sphingomonas glacialis TaxID=658225 RepID=A0A502FYM2_9SPHN|nr:TonB-dependent receptor [Sphingomonas glacialis]TPG54579.1 TonB-dependent receptor [Sphingomonas glacialis]